MSDCVCKRCRGTGWGREGFSRVTCPTCNGWGVDFTTPSAAESYVAALKRRPRNAPETDQTGVNGSGISGAE